MRAVPGGRRRGCRARRLAEQAVAHALEALLPAGDLLLRILQILRRAPDLEEVVASPTSHQSETTQDQCDAGAIRHGAASIPGYGSAMDIARDAFVDGAWHATSQRFDVRDP